jgi:hypothetical protein
LLAAFATQALGANPVPPELERALSLFHAEGAPGWAFTQTTASGSQSLVEHYNPAKPEFARWTLLQKNGATPTEAELREYQEHLSRRTGNATAPNVKDQIDPASCELVRTENDRASYRFHLRPGGSDDRSAAHMTAIFTLHKPTATIECVELAAFEPFSPMFAVKIAEAKTTMLYSLPENDRPSLLKQIDLRIRGRALWFKSLDEDMTVIYSDPEYIGKKTAPTTPENPARPTEPAR